MGIAYVSLTYSQDPDAIQTARLSIVDLAGSERANNTHNTGERLKEAGNINKSLMVLGQCMEALRINQKKLGSAPPNGSNIKLGLVPFRHSKLTELFQDFFVGDGKAVSHSEIYSFHLSESPAVGDDRERQPV